MIHLTTSEARQDFSKVIRGVKKGKRFLLSRHNKGVAAIVSVEDLAILQEIEDRRDVLASDAALEDAEKNGTVPWEKIKADLGL